MSVIYDVYGFGEAALGEEPDRLAELLGVTWEERHSDYRGRYLAGAGAFLGGGRLLLQANDLHDESGDYLQLPAFPESRFLLFADEVTRPDHLRTLLSDRPQWRFLQRRELD